MRTKTLGAVFFFSPSDGTRDLGLERQGVLIQGLSRVTFLLLDTLAQGGDQVADISHGNLKWEVDGSEHLGEEYPPTCQGGQEAKGTSRNLQALCYFSVSQCSVPVCASENDESEKESKEDGHKDEICPKSADEVDQTQESHEEEEEACVDTD